MAFKVAPADDEGVADEEDPPSPLREAAKASSSQSYKGSKDRAGGPTMSSRQHGAGRGVKGLHEHPRLAALRRVMKRVLASGVFKGLQVGALCFALFGGNIWAIANVPDDPGLKVLDALMLVVTSLFVFEMALLSIVQYREYPLSTFFWMDVLGTLSMAFEVSFLLGRVAGGFGGDSSLNSTFLRVLRATKVAARAGRLSKILKCLSFLNAHIQQKQEQADGGGVQARILSSRLLIILSTKVSLLTVVLVLVVPLFQIGQYPEEDLSMAAWSQRLEDEYARAYTALSDSPDLANSTSIFLNAVQKLQGFYNKVDYDPYKLQGFPEDVQINGRWVSIPGASLINSNDQEPGRSNNRVRRSAGTCLVPRAGCADGDLSSVYFDFTSPNQASAGTDVAMVVFIVFVMTVASANFTSTLNALIVEPVEQILTMIKRRAAELLNDLGDVGEESGEDEDDQAPGKKSETEVLECMFKKLIRLAQLAATRNVATEAEIEALDHEGKGVMVDMMQLEVQPKAGGLGGRGRLTMPRAMLGGQDAPGSSDNLGIPEEGLAVLGLHPVDRSKIESWDMDFLALDVDTDAHKTIVLYIFFDSQLGESAGRMWTTLETFNRFHNVVRTTYNDAPYHNFPHACDVLHTVYRLLCTTLSSRWVREIDQHALLTAAFCHDLGHEGLTNAYLVETKHELALRYNDKSPLENMHCARLFQICSEPENNVFERAAKDDHKQARKVCISTILHTDLVNHMGMVKDITRVYELNSEICEAQAEAPRDEILPEYEQHVLAKESLLWLELFLHLADVSNPLKPFPICKAWAWRVLDEFFAQGDEEKRLGLPVGMLNDRDKTNRPGSQHGFIAFLVSPLVISSVQLFSSLHPLSTQMASNLASWRDLWVEDAKPSTEDIAKRDAEVRKFKDLAEKLRARRMAPEED